MINVGIGAYYYMRVVRQMFFDDRRGRACACAGVDSATDCRAHLCGRYVLDRYLSAEPD